MLRSDNVGVGNILQEISFSAEKGSFTAVIGKNGSGKTTLAKCIMGEKIYTGMITLGGIAVTDISPRDRARKLAYLPQSLPSPNITVRELVSLGRSPYISLGGRMSAADLDAVEKALTAASLQALAERMLPTLSGGEKQRAYLAMTLAQDTDVLLLDEPTAFMDMSAASEFLKLLSKLEKTRIAIIHDLTLALKYADNVLILDGGRQTFFGSREECLKTCAVEKTFNVRRIENNGEIIFSV